MEKILVLLLISITTISSMISVILRIVIAIAMNVQRVAVCMYALLSFVVLGSARIVEVTLG